MRPRHSAKPHTGLVLLSAASPVFLFVAQAARL